MKRLNRALIVASLALLPFASHAAGPAPLTRAQVRAELIAAEQNGTYPTSKAHYPDARPDAATKYVANKAANAANAANAKAGPESAEDASYGAPRSGTSESGKRLLPAGTTGRPQSEDIYRGH